MNTYFAKPIGLDTPIKIGRALTPGARVYDLRWKGRKCELLAAIDRDIEGQLHARFADWHEGGEWFTANPELAEAIRAAKDFQHLLDLLPDPRRLTGCGRWHKTQIGKLAAVPA